MTSTTNRPARAARPWGAGALASRLDSPVTSYYVLLGATAVLVVIGLVMVLSASMVTSYKDDGSSFAVFLKQAQFALVGLVATLVAARLPVLWWKRLALPALVGSLLLQLLVFTPLGVTVNGNRNWLRFSGSLSFQPSELTKLGLVLVGALVFANKGQRVRTLHQIVVPYVLPISAVTIGLVLLGHDLGTAVVLLGIVGAVLWAAGVPSRFFLATAGAAAFAAALLVVTSATRMGRITNWLSGSCNDPDGACGQSVHGLYALADGSWWGVGLGASKEKWAWLAEAQNDFIFAIIGEELGLPGTLSLLLLFAMIAAACYRIVYRTRDPFVRIATAGVMAWLMLQAIINIGGVIGLLPVVGVPLPLVSAGGSALVTTMVAMGMLISFARTEPGAAEILATRPSVVKRSLAVLPGRRRRR
ncbi:MAG: putative lipid II flippase FtsW [Dermatophilaceae bacterium]